MPRGTGCPARRSLAASAPRRRRCLIAAAATPRGEVKQRHRIVTSVSHYASCQCRYRRALCARRDADVAPAARRVATRQCDATRSGGALPGDPYKLFLRPAAPPSLDGHGSPEHLRIRQVMLRQPDARAVSHFRMLQKLAARGEGWAQVMHSSALPCHAMLCNAMTPTRYTTPRAGVHTERQPRRPAPRRNRRLQRVCGPVAAAARRRGRGCERQGGAGAAGGRAFAPCVARLRVDGVRLPRVRGRPIGLHAAGAHLVTVRTACSCAPPSCKHGVLLSAFLIRQVRAWMNAFEAKQLLVLTLDEFASAPAEVCIV